MPELAEVAFFRKQWEVGLGDSVQQVALHTDKRVFRDTDTHAITSLKGKSFATALSHGKQMLFGFEPDGWLIIHLGMTGKLWVGPSDLNPGKHDHLVLFQETQSLVFTDSRLFGRVRFFSGSEMPQVWSDLPPEILNRRFNRKRVEEFLTRHRRSPIKALLLNQEGFPGIGNWMADEVVWRVRLHPATLAGELDAVQVTALWKALKEVSREALETIGEDWSDPPDSWLFNHRWKDGGHCPRRGCGEALVRASLRGRTTCWCPRCQR